MKRVFSSAAYRLKAAGITPAQQKDEDLLARIMMRIYSLQGAAVRAELTRIQATGDKSVAIQQFQKILREAKVKKLWNKAKVILRRAHKVGLDQFGENQDLGKAEDEGLGITESDLEAVNATQETPDNFIDTYVNDLEETQNYAAAVEAVRLIPDLFGEQADSVDEVMDKLHFDAVRARRIAVTNYTNATAQGMKDAAERWQLSNPGLHLIQEWLTSRDELVCIICAPLDGVTAELQAPFVHPETGEEYPAPAAHWNCRCQIIVYEEGKRGR